MSFKENSDSKDKSNLDNYLENFRNTFIFNNSNKSKPEIKGQGLDISLKSYQQPKVTPELQKKIEILSKISGNINDQKIAYKELPDKDFKLNYKQALNEQQFFAATSLEGPILVIAGAGSGKTRTIVYRVAYMLENDIPPEKILLLTFTRKASKEMLDRTISLLKDNRANSVVGGTFHSFANHVLRKYYKFLDILPNFTIIDTGDSEDIIDLIRQELKFDKKQRAFPRKSRIQSIISKSRNCNIEISEVIENEYKGLKDFSDDIQVIKLAYSEYKKANNIFDYDDLMEYLRDSLRDNQIFRERLQNVFTYIMVDEFQDTNVIQKEIVDYIAEKNKNIMVVGDDAQSIYAFRGATVENILRFPETYPDCKVIKIERNYRSSQDILNFTNSIIDKSKIGYKKQLFSTKQSSGKPIIKKFYNQENEAEYIVDRILELREKNVPLNQIAVLYRTSYHGNYVQAELIKRNIPYLVYGGIKFTERRHVKDLISYLRVTLNPMDSISWNRILKLLPGVGGSTSSNIIRNIHNANGQIEISEFSKKKFFKQLQELQEVLNEVKKEEMILAKKIDVLKDYYSDILKTLEDDYEVRLLDLDVLYTLSEKYEKLEKFLSDFALDPPSNKFQDKTTPLIDETEDKPVTLSTIHSSKGLEWNTVFVVHLLDGLLPGAVSLKNLEDLEEERRLFYVATTRAKDNLFLTMPSCVRSWDSFFTLPSRFLVEIENERYRYLR